MTRVLTQSQVDLQSWYNQGLEVSDKLIRPEDISNEVLDRFTTDGVRQTGTALPWEKTYDKWRIRPGEVTVWAGINGHFKSMVTSQVALHLATKGESVFIASLEMPVVDTMTRLTIQGLGPSNYTREKGGRLHHCLGDKMWLLDHTGSIEWQQVVGLGYLAAKGLYDIDHLIIDSLMMLIPEEEEYGIQKRIVNDLCVLARDTGLHVHLVHHARKGHNEDDPINKFSVKGTGAIMDLAHNGVLVWHNKRKERELEKNIPDPDITSQADLVIDVCKQRNGNGEGKFGLYYNRRCMQFLNEVGPPIDYLSKFEQLEAA